MSQQYQGPPQSGPASNPQQRQWNQQPQPSFGQSQWNQQPLAYPQQPVYAPQQQQPYMPPPTVPTPKKKSRKGLWIVLAVVILVIIIAVASHSGGSSPSTSTTSSNTNTTTQPTAKPTTATQAKPTTATAKWTTVQTFTGNGAKKTGVLAVPNDWKIVWTCNGQNIGGVTADGALTVSVYNSDSTIADPGAVNATCKAGSKPTSDVTEEHQSGNIYLDVNATGDWTIQVQELK